MPTYRTRLIRASGRPPHLRCWYALRAAEALLRRYTN